MSQDLALFSNFEPKVCINLNYVTHNVIFFFKFQFCLLFHQEVTMATCHMKAASPIIKLKITLTKNKLKPLT